MDANNLRDESIKSLPMKTACLFCFVACLSPACLVADKPNIVMIFTDDPRHDAVGYIGDEVVHTPNLNRLAGRGLVFENCFVNTSICAVTPMHVGRFLDGRDAEKPFYMMLFFKSPHAPFTDWDPATEHLTDGVSMPVPPAATLANAEREPEIIKRSLGRPSGMNYLTNPKSLDRHMRDYYRLIASMDIGVGHVMESLRQRGLDQNTVILFTSDNGHYKGEHGLAGKWLMHEPSLRVPGFLLDPRRDGGKRTSKMVITTDFSATMLALAGIDVPADMSGRDLSELYSEPKKPWRDDFYYDHPYGHGGKIPRSVGVRTATHSYTRYIDPNPPFEQLFDLETDPHQLNNLANDPEHSELLQQLRNRCDQLAGEVGSVQRLK
jgi:arylsulfatase A-like enzyme